MNVGYVYEQLTIYLTYCVVQGFIKKWMTEMNRLDMGIAIAHIKMSNDNFKFAIEKSFVIGGLLPAKKPVIALRME